MVMATNAMREARMATIEEISSEIVTPRPEPVAPPEINRESEPDPEPAPAPVSEDSGKMFDLYV